MRIRDSARHPNKLRQTLLRAVVVFGLAFFAMQTSVIGDEAGDRATVHWLRDRYGLSVPEIAKLLTQGGHIEGQAPKLARWEEGRLRVAVIATPEIPEILIKSISDRFSLLAATAKRDIEWCIERARGEDGAKVEPLPNQRNCLGESETGIVIVADASGRHPGALIEAISSGLGRSDGMKSFWRAAVTTTTMSPNAVNCGAHFDVHSDTGSISVGSAYIRVGGLDDANLGKMDDCLGVVPYTLLGGAPIDRGQSYTFEPKLLQLLYSDRLSEGMSAPRIIELLSH